MSLAFTTQAFRNIGFNNKLLIVWSSFINKLAANFFVVAEAWLHHSIICTHNVVRKAMHYACLNICVSYSILNGLFFRDLSINQFSGTVPPEIGKLVNLDNL